MKSIPKNIKCILFDLGGVVINIDWKRSVYAFCDLTGKSFDELNQMMRKEELVQGIETGKLNPQEFREWFRKLFNKKIDNKSIDSAWNAMLLDIPTERIKLIQELRNNYSVMCLSNTNEIHIRDFNSKLSAVSTLNNLEELMHKTYYSHLLETRKPDPKAWTIILEENQLEPESVLYFEDNKINHQVALNLGINSVLIDQQNTIEKYFYE